MWFGFSLLKIDHFFQLRTPEAPIILGYIFIGTFFFVAPGCIQISCIKDFSPDTQYSLIAFEKYDTVSENMVVTFNEVRAVLHAHHKTE